MPVRSTYYRVLDADRVQCLLCMHYCILRQGEYGLCRVRQNVGNELYSLNYGAITGVAIDPMEKKPLYHFLPGSRVLSLACYGCNFTCLNCQNYGISDYEKFDINRIISDVSNMVSPEQIAGAAIHHKCEAIAYTYSEPSVFWEYCEDVIRITKSNTPQIKHLMVSNGYFSRELLQNIIDNELIDAMNIDLKFMNDYYESVCGGKLNPILKNIQHIVQNSNIHIEVTNLMIPSLNDDAEEVQKLCDFIVSLSPGIPVHFSKFFPTHKMKDFQHTSEESLILARDIALSSGLRYVYIGNTNLQNVSNTLCPECKNTLIQRNHYNTLVTGIIENKCSQCGSEIKNIILK